MDEVYEQIGSRLRNLGLTLAVAESCTGGLIGHWLTQVAGSSDYFLGGIVAYANRAKTALLGVSADDLARHGAVSEIVARQMAEGVRRAFGADAGVATTGVLGPGGGTPAKPVGLVFVAAAIDGGCTVRRLRNTGSRIESKERSAREALLLLGETLQTLGG